MNLSKNFIATVAGLTFSFLVSSCSFHIAAAQEADGKIQLAGGKLTFSVPKEWKKVQPKPGMVQYEFSAPVDAKADEQARVTIVAAGGSVEANIDRWYGQFEQADGKPTKDKAKAEVFEVDGQKVHFVDIPGKFKETMGGPFGGGKTVVHDDYRMLGAIIVTKDAGQHFIKVTGPSAVLEKLVDGFKKSLKELEVN